MQRILKYHLLLEKLLSETQPVILVWSLDLSQARFGLPWPGNDSYVFFTSHTDCTLLRFWISILFTSKTERPIFIPCCILLLLQNHEDYRGLERAREAMVDVAQYINEVKRDSDTLQIMSDIQVRVKIFSIPIQTFTHQYLGISSRTLISFLDEYHWLGRHGKQAVDQLW